MSTGSLGMGISAAMGMALGARLTGRDVRAFVMLGDGECQEGEVWEAAMAAARYGLDNLIAIVDHNGLQQYGWPGDGPDGRIPPQVPGELVAQVDGVRLARPRGRRPRHGRDPAACSTRPRRGDGRPTAIIAHTVKGKGVSFMEGRYYWHTRVIKPEEFAMAMADLGEPLPATRRRAAMTLPMGRPMREIFGETVAELADDDPGSSCSTATSAPRPGPTSSRRPTRTASSRWGSPSRTWSAWRPAWRRWAWSRSSARSSSFAVVRPLDQVRVLIAQTGANVKIGAGYAGLLTGLTGKSHIIVEDLAIMRAMPGMVTRRAGRRRRGAAVLRWAAAYEGPSTSGWSATPRRACSATTTGSRSAGGRSSARAAT